MGAQATISLQREAAIGFVINGILSLAFFIGIFGLLPRVLTWAAADRLGLDFIPQSVAVALMSALVPCLLARRQMAPPPMIGSIIKGALLSAFLGGVAGGVLALLSVTIALPPIGWATALILKIAYGGLLGAFVSTMSIRRMMA